MVKSNYLKINRIKIEGIWTLDHEFKGGLNAVITANKHGKTTLIQTILAAIGFSDKRKNEAKKNASKVYLELLLNDKLKTIEMDTNETDKGYKTYLYLQDNVNIDGFDQKKSKMISRKDLNGLIEKEIGLNPYIYRDKVNKRYPLNNLNQSYRAFYLMQGKANEIISDYQAQDIRRTVTQSLLRSPKESNVFEDKSTDYGSQIKEKDKEKDAIIRSTNKKQHQIKEYAINIISDKEKIEEIDFNKIESIEKIIIDIDSQINEISKNKNDLINKLNDIYDNVKNHEIVLKIEKLVEDLDNNKNQTFKESLILEQEINSISKKIQYYQEEIIEINNKLDKRDYSIPLRVHNPTNICDRCGRKLPTSRINLEKQTPPKCALCGRIRDVNLLKPEKLKDRRKIIEETLNIQKNKLNHNETKNKKVLQKILKIKNSIEEKKNEIENLRKNLTRESTSKILEEYKKIDDELIDWKEKKINVFQYAENLREIPKLNKAISKLRKEKKEYDAKFKFKEKIREDWERNIQFFMKKVGFEDEGDKIIKLDPKTMLPTIDGKSWKNDLVDNEKHLYNLGMYYSFLKCSLIHQIKYPRFIVWDCWKTGELDKEKAKRIGKILKDLNEKYSNDFQMIIFTADEIIEGYIPPENVLKRKFTKEKEEYLFLEKGVIKYSKP